ncbi:DUF3667 domain-containing protein [Mucilaginibacter sp. X5P1]|uniref:DUF3667 domain-containing protein n=1 Tax=Mucilaginibacter sp. X5P1 TaxID=2723088 RepID=UPI0016167E0E|nr:DUF3667 domain-containing protein [Mucilaginibacter sp. X5P1]MBB6138439.1 hypothetical protein [Mucilaginibacter sp. X5P1]
MKKHYRKENDCLNCGTTLQGKFCYNCGQENLEIKESFGHMMSHTISDYFHFDDQFFHTLKPLFLKPGFLTTEYLAGRRARYLHPVKMYIFISLVYFIVLFQTGHNPVKVNHVIPAKSTDVQLLIDSIEKDPDIPAFAKNEAIRELKKDTLKNGKVTIEDEDKNSSKYFMSPKSNDTSYTAYLAAQQKLPEDKQDGIFLRLYNKKAFAYKAEYGERTKEVILEQFKHNMPKMMFLMLPLCALILMIAFWNNRKYYVEYLIYSFHLHCFIFLFLTIIMVLEWLYPSSWKGVTGWINFFATIIVTWYIYKSLKVVYQRSTWRTITKLIGASFMYMVAFMFCILVAFLITAALA